MVLVVKVRLQVDTLFLMSLEIRWLAVHYGLEREVTMRLKHGPVKHLLSVCNKWWVQERQWPSMVTPNS